MTTTSDQRCALTDLIEWMCAHCLGHESEPDIGNDWAEGSSPVHRGQAADL